MILCVDIGNTNIVLGCYEGKELKMLSRMSSNRDMTRDQYAISLKDILSLYGISERNIGGAIISSVVPAITNPMLGAVELATGRKPLLLGSHMHSDMEIALDNPAEIGADLFAAAYGAREKYPLPLIVADLGTATKLMVVDESGRFLGGAILPGIRISADALNERTSTLPGFSLEAPKSVIGANTIDALKSGAICAAACAVDGMCERMFEQIGRRGTVVATGGLAHAVVPLCRVKPILDERLILDGLLMLYEKHKEEK